MKKVFLFTILTVFVLLCKQTVAQSDTLITTNPSSPVDELADKEAHLKAYYLSQKYDKNPLMENALYLLFHSRELQINNIYKKYIGSDQLDIQLIAIIKKFDSLENSLIHAARANLFLQNKLTELNNIKPLNDKSTAELQLLYRKATLQNKDKGFADIFNEVMHRVVKDTMYYATLYKEEINYQATTSAKRVAFLIFQKNHLTREGYDNLYPLVYSKERYLSVINYTLPVYTKYKDSICSIAISNYDSLISKVLMKDGCFQNISQFSIAVKNRKKLELSAKQVDTLIDKAVTLEKMIAAYLLKNPLGKFDTTPFEAKSLSSILSEEQYLKLLSIKNKPQADEWANGDWAELQERGMTTGLDSFTVVYEIAQFNSNRLVVTDRYADDKVKQYVQMKSLEDKMPAILKKLKKARDNDNSKAFKLNSTQAVKASFQW